MFELSTKKEAFTVSDAAEKMVISEYTVKRLIREGKLKAQLIGRKYYTTAEAIHACQVLRGYEE